MRTKKWMQTGLAAVMASALLIAGCSGGNNGNKNSASGNDGEVSTEPVTFTYFGFRSQQGYHGQ